jgi:hypothetical protein
MEGVISLVSDSSCLRNVPMTGTKKKVPFRNVPMTGTKKKVPLRNVPMTGTKKKVPLRNVPMTGTKIKVSLFCVKVSLLLNNLIRLPPFESVGVVLL